MEDLDQGKVVVGESQGKEEFSEAWGKEEGDALSVPLGLLGAPRVQGFHDTQESETSALVVAAEDLSRAGAATEELV